ncbi:Uncharacterised protein [Bordetella ansorpii]|uniref:Transmembrane protein n=1 Tax=Bordetella ansorpii TaxID=288768 RepID=A0A157NKU1_9BORD|nr:hypothetical protein [Bordetella ansorpii]SAI21925.1 Uncharacterised protein [Bordetella ansorpii]
MSTVTTPMAGYAPAAVVSNGSAVSWGAVIAGAVIAAALSAMLLVGGSGLGFLAMSPWKQEGASGGTLAIGTIVWLLVTQVIAYGVAGYVAGRLRTRWTDAAADEIYFRDTAHGFLVWALSAVLAVVMLGAAAGSLLNTAGRAAGAVAGSAGDAAAAMAQHRERPNMPGFSLDYFTDALLRPADAAPPETNGDPRREVSRILANSLSEGKLSEQDRAYLVKLVARRAGVDEATAQQRVDQLADQARQAAAKAEQKAREAADAARKAAAVFALWAFASLLIGAFVASWTATWGGRARDR